MRDVFFTLSLTHSLLFFCLVGWVTRTRKERELEKLGTCGRQGGRGSEPCVLAGFFPSVWVNLESRLGRLAILFFLGVRIISSAVWFCTGFTDGQMDDRQKWICLTVM